MTKTTILIRSTLMPGLARESLVTADGVHVLPELRHALHDPEQGEHRRRHDDGIRHAQEVAVGEILKALVEHLHRVAAADDDGQPLRGPPDPEGRDEGRHADLRVEQAADEPGKAADCQDDGDDPEAHVIASEGVLDEKARDHGAQRDDPFGGEVHGADHDRLVDGQADNHGNARQAEDGENVLQRHRGAARADCKDEDDDGKGGNLTVHPLRDKREHATHSRGEGGS